MIIFCLRTCQPAGNEPQPPHDEIRIFKIEISHRRAECAKKKKKKKKWLLLRCNVTSRTQNHHRRENGYNWSCSCLVVLAGNELRHRRGPAKSGKLVQKCAPATKARGKVSLGVSSGWILDCWNEQRGSSGWLTGMTGLAGSGSLWPGVRLGVTRHSQQPKSTAGKGEETAKSGRLVEEGRGRFVVYERRGGRDKQK